MQFSEDKPTHAYVFQRADAQGFLINNTLYTHSIFITAEPRLHDWNLTCIADLNDTHLAPLMVGNPDLILLGTGAHPIHLPHVLLAHCWEKRIGLEAMTTLAAARTYNVLANEGRRVAVGLLLITH